MRIAQCTTSRLMFQRGKKLSRPTSLNPLSIAYFE